jgi:membrane-bound lytic murein transglycosylase B
MGARRRPAPLLAVVATVALVPAIAGALPAAAAPSTTTSTSTTSPATTTTSSPAGLPPTTAAASTTSSTSSTSTTAPPRPTVPPAGAPVDNLQLDAINAQFLADVEAEVGAAQDALDRARAQVVKAQAMDEAASGTLTAETQRLNDLDSAQRRQALALQSARGRLRDLAIDAYVSGGPGAPIQQLLSSGDINEFARREGYFSAVANAGKDAINTYARAREQSTRTARATADELQRAQAAKRAAHAELQAAQAAVAGATKLLNDRQSLLTLTSDAVTTGNTDIPRMVLDAYQRAAVAMQAKGCHLAWWGLAGIGKVESDHGRAEHAHLAANGDLVPHIVGVPLTGQGGTALIQDQNGAFAHAEGPMQFIPSTWAVWGEDGNTDGVKDVDNIYDAALGAAAYLCATSTELETDLGLLAAYYSYNHSTDYATEVLAYAKTYEGADAAGLIPPLSPMPLWSLAPKPNATPAASTTSTTSTTTRAP